MRDVYSVARWKSKEEMKLAIYGYIYRESRVRHVDVYICGLPHENVRYGNFLKKHSLAFFATSMRDVSMGQSACSYPFPFLRY